MKKLLWPVVAFCVALWSGLAWAAYQVVDWGGQIVSNNVDIVTPHPESVEWLSWFARFGSNVGESLVVGVWAVGVVIAIGLGFVGSRLLPGLGNLSESLKSRA